MYGDICRILARRKGCFTSALWNLWIFSLPPVCRTCRVERGRTFIRDYSRQRDSFNLREYWSILDIFTTHFNVEFYYDAVIRRSLIGGCDNTGCARYVAKKNSTTTGESFFFFPPSLFRGEFRPPRVCRDKYNGFLSTIGGTFKSKVLEESLANKFFTWWQFLHVSEATSRNGYGGSITKGMAARGAKFNYVRKTG